MPSTAPAPALSSAGIATDTNTGERLIPASRRPDGSLRREIRVRPGYRPPEDIELYRTRNVLAAVRNRAVGVPGAAPAPPAGKGLATGGVSGTAPAAPAVADPPSATAGKNAKKRESRRRRTTEGGGTYAPVSANTDINAAPTSSDSQHKGAGTNTASSKSNNIMAKASWRRSSPEDVQVNGNAKPEPKPALVEAAPAPVPVDKANADTAASAPASAPATDTEKQARTLRKKLRQARELRARRDGGMTLLPEQLYKVVSIDDLAGQLARLGVDDVEADADAPPQTNE